MNAIMAISADGFLCLDEEDDMSWTGPTDKFIFQLLTLSNSQPLFAGKTTYEHLPLPLKGRTVYKLSRIDGLELKHTQKEYPAGWLIGGPSIIYTALREHYIHQFYLCRSHAILGTGWDDMTLMSLLPPKPVHRIKHFEITVSIYKPQDYQYQGE